MNKKIVLITMLVLFLFAGSMVSAKTVTTKPIIQSTQSHCHVHWKPIWQQYCHYETDYDDCYWDYDNCDGAGVTYYDEDGTPSPAECENPSWVCREKRVCEMVKIWIPFVTCDNGNHFGKIKIIN